MLYEKIQLYFGVGEQAQRQKLKDTQTQILKDRAQQYKSPELADHPQLSRRSHDDMAGPITNAIEPGWIVSECGVGEMEQSIGKHARLQWNPSASGEVCGGFNYDRDVRCSGDVETALVALNI